MIVVPWPRNFVPLTSFQSGAIEGSGEPGDPGPDSIVGNQTFRTALSTEPKPLSPQPLVSVVVPTKDRAESLRACLESIARQHYRHFEIIVVDGGSTDETAQVVEKVLRRTAGSFLLQEGGLIAQENAGWKSARGEIIIRTDDDVVADPLWLEGIVEGFAVAPDIGGVTGPTIIPPSHRGNRDLFLFQEKLERGNLFWRLVGRIYSNVFMEGDPYAVSRWYESGAFSLGSNFEQCLHLPGPIEVDHHEACNMAVRKDLLEAVGGFDESFVGIGEYNEPDVSFKIRKLGCRIIFHPKARVNHLPSLAGFFADRPDAYGRALNFITFYFRHIRPNTPKKAAKFGLYLLFLNAFWTYKFLTTSDAKQLRSLTGTLVGLARHLLRAKKQDETPT